jgi:sortase A
MRGAMPLAVTMPLSFDSRPRTRRRRRRRVALGVLIALGAALLAVGFWLPAKAELAQQLLNRAWDRAAAGDAEPKPGPRADTHGASVIAGHRDTHFRRLATLAIGDELVVERPGGATLTYQVTALDVVDSRRAQLRLDADESIVVLVACWPFDAVEVGGSWRYVVTAHLVAPSGKNVRF